MILISSKGKWKMLQYFAEKMFAQILLSPVKVNHTHCEVHVVSNSRASMEKAAIVVSVQRYDSLTNNVAAYQETLFTGVFQVG